MKFFPIFFLLYFFLFSKIVFLKIICFPYDAISSSRCSRLKATNASFIVFVLLLFILFFLCTPGAARTHDLKLRRFLLCPTELQKRFCIFNITTYKQKVTEKQFFFSQIIKVIYFITNELSLRFLVNLYKSSLTALEDKKTL